ncbi:hypothetical protein [Moorena sp. SIO3B2]|uniref:hypothetical protein n=1 Tax=Moorena sp. SIO3B2 TaxID=2607827 RepID=UPI0013C9FC33|nr:hypothetical protein [Moorena sp. SIO3B2]NEP34341.1 hypothetical protein [Moorena sp. SIO3B2]
MDFPFTRDQAKLPLKAIANVINPCEAVDQLDEGMLLSPLPQQFQHPSLDRDRNLPLWEDGDGQQSAMKLRPLGHALRTLPLKAIGRRPRYAIARGKNS